MTRLVLATVPLALLLAGCSSAPTSSGACAAPQTKIAPRSAAPGQAVTVSAPGMWDGCNDQGFNAKLPPLKNQAVTMTVGGTAVVVGRVSVDPETGVAQAHVTIPAAAKVGTMAVTIGVAEPVELTITAK